MKIMPSRTCTRKPFSFNHGAPVSTLYSVYQFIFSGHYAFNVGDEVRQLPALLSANWMAPLTGMPKTQLPTVVASWSCLLGSTRPNDLYGVSGLEHANRGLASTSVGASNACHGCAGRANRLHSRICRNRSSFTPVLYAQNWAGIGCSRTHLHFAHQ